MSLINTKTISESICTRDFRVACGVCGLVPWDSATIKSPVVTPTRYYAPQRTKKPSPSCSCTKYLANMLVTKPFERIKILFRRRITIGLAVITLFLLLVVFLYGNTSLVSLWSLNTQNTGYGRYRNPMWDGELNQLCKRN